MKKTEPEQNLMADEELDAALAQMAEEVPPVPAGFRERWMEAVLAEAKGAAPAAGEPVPETEKPAPKNTVSFVRWTRILSVAAAFVFLIGGTLLYRNTKKTLSGPVAMMKQETAESAAAPAAEEEETLAAGEVQVVAAEDAAEPGTEEPVMMDSLMQDAGWVETEEESAAEADMPYNMKNNGTALNASAAFEEEADYAAEASFRAGEADSAGEAAFEAAPVMTAVPTAALTAAPTEGPTATPTAAPTDTPEPSDTPVPSDTPAPAEEPEAEGAGFLQDTGAFFADMGDFLLAALPYLLVLAVPAVVALAVRRKKKAGGS